MKARIRKKNKSQSELGSVYSNDGSDEEIGKSIETHSALNQVEENENYNNSVLRKRFKKNDYSSDEG